MSDNRRQEIRNEISKSSKEQYILEEMKKLGYWPDDEVMPSLSEQLIEKESALNKELRELYQKRSAYQNPDQALALLRKERMKASREKQKETKLRKAEERKQKAEDWKKLKDQKIVYLGENVSQELNHNKTEIEKLTELQLPILKDEQELAAWLNVSVGKLRFLTFNREVSKLSHYRQFKIKKKTGGERLISAPMPQLKRAQHQVLEGLLNQLIPHEAAHGFRQQHSIVSNAKIHVGQEVIVNIDLKDFFPTVEYPRVKGFFKSLGYSGKVATVLALLCTEAPIDKVQLDGIDYFIKTGARHLPQGAPTSPAITNSLCRKMDTRIEGLAKKYNFQYTRYADDMTFSTTAPNKHLLPKLLANVRRIVKDEGFRIHPDKTRVMHKHTQQEVTGVIVNEKLNVSRKKIDKFRSLLFQIEKDGIEGKHWNGSPNLLAAIKGYANFIHSVNPVKGAPLLQRVNAILKQYKFQHEIKYPNRTLSSVEDIPATAKEVKASKDEKKKWSWWPFKK